MTKATSITENIVAKATFSLILSILTSTLCAQVARVNIVEHFTNSNCSVCANSNPSIYSTLSNYPSTLHITFHPSSPYTSCFFSMQNPSENDARTNFYGIYGSTPKLIVNGSLTSASNLSSTLQSALSANSNFDIYTTQIFIASDSVEVTVVIKKIAPDSLTSATLFVGAFQDTVMQTTGNGESIHKDVFRKSLSASAGNTITLPMNVNDSVEFTYTYNIPSNWMASRMNSLAILQHNATKEVLQTSKSMNINTIPTSVGLLTRENIIVYPNPVSDFLYLKNASSFNTYAVSSLDGKVIQDGLILQNRIDLKTLPHGNYIIILTNSTTYKTIQITK